MMRFQSLKSNLEKISQATEERLLAVKATIQQKLNDNNEQKKKKEDEKDVEPSGDDILEGWTMLGDKRKGGKSVEIDPDSLLSEPEVQPLPPAEVQSIPVVQSDPALEDIPIGTPQAHPLDSYMDSDSRNVNFQHDSGIESDDDITPSRLSIDTTSTTSSIIMSSAPQKSELSEDTVGRFGLLSSAIMWNILSLLQAFDLCQLAQTSVQFSKLAYNEFLWERLYIRVFRKNNLKVDKALWYEQIHYGGYRSLYGTKLCEEQMDKTVRSMQNTDHNAVEWICKPLVSVSNFFSTTDVKALIFGLDGVGKTSILYKLIRGEAIIRTSHTIGFNTETLEYKGYNFEFWDLEHKPKNAFEFWRTYLVDTKAIIFVIDGTSPETLSKAKATMDSFLADPQLAKLPLLVYVNKRDVLDSMSTLQVLVGLKLHYLCSISGWHVQPCSTVASDYSIEEGLDWLVDSFRNQEVQKLKTKIVS